MSEIWSVRGVSPTLRRAIVKAAEREGLSVAEWLEQRLANTFADSAPTAGPAADSQSIDGLLTAIDSCLADIEQLHRTGLRGPA